MYLNNLVWTSLYRASAVPKLIRQLSAASVLGAMISIGWEPVILPAQQLATCEPETTHCMPLRTRCRTTLVGSGSMPILRELRQLRLKYSSNCSGGLRVHSGNSRNVLRVR